MDIVTHALMGAVLAGPILPAAPLTGSGLLLGSVLPDLDVLSRCFGRRAFLRWHQTYTHGLPMILAMGIAAWLLTPPWIHEPWAPVGLVVGMLLHVGLDLTNTYGTAVLSPISSRRFCTEWVFFIDGVVVVASIVAVLVQRLAFGVLEARPFAVAAGYVVFLTAYWALRIALHGWAVRLGPGGTRSLIPSALVPWRFFGCAGDGDSLRVYRLNALTGTIDQEQPQRVLDSLYGELLSGLPEFQIMRRLSPAYHVTDATPTTEGVLLRCRDLRVRNFGGRFGELMVVVAADGRVVRSKFNV